MFMLLSRASLVFLWNKDNEFVIVCLYAGIVQRLYLQDAQCANDQHLLTTAMNSHALCVHSFILIFTETR